MIIMCNNNNQESIYQSTFKGKKESESLSCWSSSLNVREIDDLMRQHQTHQTHQSEIYQPQSLSLAHYMLFNLSHYLSFSLKLFNSVQLMTAIINKTTFSIHTCLCECMHLNKVSISSLISMMMLLMMLMKSMFQSYYIMLISIEIKCGGATWQPRTKKDSSANDRGATHAHAYDRHAIVTTIEQQYTRALVHLYNLQFSTPSLIACLSHVAPLSHKPSHNHLPLSYPTNPCSLIGVCHILVEDASNQPYPRYQPHWHRSSRWKIPPYACKVLEHIKSMRQVIRQRIRAAQRAR